MKSLNEATEFLHNYCDFSNPNLVYVLKGMSRNKDNSGVEGKSVRFMRRLVLAKPDDIEPCVADMRKMADDPNTVYRTYISVNARDVVKAAFTFQKKLIDIGYDLARGLPDAVQQSKKLGSIWKTQLEQTCNRGTKKFLLDVDNDNGEKFDYILTFLNQLTYVYLHRRTVSGYHIVFKACDTRELMLYCQEIGAEVDLQRDSMVFVEQWKGSDV